MQNVVREDTNHGLEPGTMALTAGDFSPLPVLGPVPDQYGFEMTDPHQAQAYSFSRIWRKRGSKAMCVG